MELNPYSMYSVVSMSEGKNAEDLGEVLKIREELDSIKHTDDARAYIKTKPASNVYSLNVRESEDLLVVNLVYQNENVSYYYNK